MQAMWARGCTPLRREGAGEIGEGAREWHAKRLQIADIGLRLVES
jgi:hypothetical protein